MCQSLNDALNGRGDGSTSFRFFDLPSELRFKILDHVLLISPLTVDLDPSNHNTASTRLNLFLVSRRFHEEAYRAFYSGHTFRIFQTHGRFLGKNELPLLARLPTRYRAAITSLELRLGPGWSKPPKPWFVSDRLGLEECRAVRTLKVFAEVDPSSRVFKGFRLNRVFFTNFSGHLLHDIIERLPALDTVEFDAYPSVDRDGALMSRLLGEANEGKKRVIWDPNRAWNDGPANGHKPSPTHSTHKWGDTLADKLELGRLRSQQKQESK
ncbi:MAG: hypothetical protein Q9190_007899 [Brigantiaea leucoxantha]